MFYEKGRRLWLEWRLSNPTSSPDAWEIEPEAEGDGEDEEGESGIG